MLILRPAFKSYGLNFIFDPDGIYGYKQITVGNDVFIGPGAQFNVTLRSSINIGNKVMFGPHVSILTGKHDTSTVGRFMLDLGDFAKPGDDAPVVIEDDVWVASHAIILRGVTLGRGCVIGAGAIVTHDIPPYALAVGVPAQVKSFRFDKQQILEHESKLYPAHLRLSRTYIDAMFEKHQISKAY
ncbi:MAG: DapH/DapD/GlmU-related protein [Caldilineaceae bacterium]